MNIENDIENDRLNIENDISIISTFTLVGIGTPGSRERDRINGDHSGIGVCTIKVYIFFNDWIEIITLCNAPH